MKMSRRKPCLLILAILTVMLLLGCQKKAETAGGEPSAVSAQSETAKSSEAENDSVSFSVYPVYTANVQSTQVQLSNGEVWTAYRINGVYQLQRLDEDGNLLVCFSEDFETSEWTSIQQSLDKRTEGTTSRSWQDWPENAGNSFAPVRTEGFAFYCCTASGEKPVVLYADESFSQLQLQLYSDKGQLISVYPVTVQEKAAVPVSVETEPVLQTVVQDMESLSWTQMDGWQGEWNAQIGSKAAAQTGVPAVWLILALLAAAASTAALWLVWTGRLTLPDAAQKMPTEIQKPTSEPESETEQSEDDKDDEENIGETEYPVTTPTATPAHLRNVATVHNIGSRKSQQDRSDFVKLGENKALALVADGMGGLADGDKVSQKIIDTMVADSAHLRDTTYRALFQMAAHVNREVNLMLGSDGLYKSGSTLLAVLLNGNRFSWISVGDSHIYLYRNGSLFLLNREHIYEFDLLQQAVNGEIPFSDVAKDPQNKRVSSFVGMGYLKYLDASQKECDLKDGDRILMMSDGVFNTISEEDICRLVSCGEDAEDIAEKIEQEVLDRKNPNQDNFTCVVMEF